MKTLMLSFLIIVGASVNAATPAPVKFSCESANALQDEFLRYSPGSSDKEATARLPSVYAVFQAFHKLPQTEKKPDGFACLVGLGAAAIQWDTDGQLTELVARLIRLPGLNDAFDAALAKFRDPCRAQQMRSSVEGRFCLEKTDGLKGEAKENAIIACNAKHQAPMRCPASTSKPSDKK